MKKKFPLGGGARLVVFDSNTIYALHGKLYRTFDGGKTWDSLTISIPQYYMASGMFFTDTENGWITTMNGTGGMIIHQYPVLNTNDGGMKWFSSDSLEDWGLMCCYFTNDNIGWVAGNQNVFRTIDGGNKWTIEFSIEDPPLGARDMIFIDVNHGWILNWWGIVYKYGNPRR